jgi:hypothetical protein
MTQLFILHSSSFRKCKYYINKRVVTVKETIIEILESLRPSLEAHKCSLELYDVQGETAVIYCSGEGATCEKKCVEDAIKNRLPTIKIEFINT